MLQPAPGATGLGKELTDLGRDFLGFGSDESRVVAVVVPILVVSCFDDGIV